MADKERDRRRKAMMISLFNMTRMYSSHTGAKPFQLKSSGHMVGRDVNPLSQTSVMSAHRRDLVRAEGEDVRFTAQTVFDVAKNQSANGNFVSNFRSVSVDDPDNIDARNDRALFKNETHKVTFEGNALNIYERNEEGVWDLKESRVAKDDMRLTWDSSGNPQILEGAEARVSGNVLKAQGNNEILIRVNAKDVEAGGGSVVINLSDKKGKFSGGDGVTYIGSYGKDTVIEGGKGNTNYAGYFKGAEIRHKEGPGTFSGVFAEMLIGGSSLGDSFSGYFSAVDIAGGDGKNSFGGMFLAGSSVAGGANDDRFNGRYVDSSLEGGEGNDTFGQGIDLKGASVLSADGKVYSHLLQDGGSYHGVSADFVDSSIIAGEGNNSVNSMVWGGKIELGSGNDEVRGSFIETNVNAGDGNDTIAAMYSENSMFDTGNGNDHLRLATARNNAVVTGEGSNSVSMGSNPGRTGVSDGSGLGGDSVLSRTTFSSKYELNKYRDGNMTIGIRFGELESNRLNAELGQNSVHVDNGTGTQSLFIDNKRTMLEAPESSEEAGESETDGKKTKETPTAAEAVMAAAIAANSPQQSESQADGGKSMSSNITGDRFAILTGNGPLVDGGSALKIQTGAGEDIDMRYNARDNWEKIEGKGIRTFTRRFNGYKSRMI